MKKQLESKPFHSKICVCLQKQCPAEPLLVFHNIPKSCLFEPPIKRHKSVRTLTSFRSVQKDEIKNFTWIDSEYNMLAHYQRFF